VLIDNSLCFILNEFQVCAWTFVYFIFEFIDFLLEDNPEADKMLEKVVVISTRG
jgi:hypothetical protein